MTQKICFITFTVLSVCSLISQGYAQTHAIDGEHITEWLVLGPLFPDDLDDMASLAGVGREVRVQPRAGDSLTTATGTTLTWKRYQSPTNVIDLLDAVGNHEHATAYAFCLLQSEFAGDGQVQLKGKDGVAVWVNGQRVHHNPGAFDDVFEADLKAGPNSCLVKVSNGPGGWDFAMRVLPPNRAVIAGVVTNKGGQPIADAVVRLEHSDPEVRRVDQIVIPRGKVKRGEIPSVGTRTDASGRYRLNVYPVRGRYDLSVTLEDMVDWQLGIPLREGERRKLNLTLKKTISIEGTLLMLDDKTPHVAVPVQAVRIDNPQRTIIDDQSSIINSKVVTTLTNEKGNYHFINLKPGSYHVRFYTPDGYVYYGANNPSPRGIGARSEKPGEQGSGASASPLGSEAGRAVLNVKSGATFSKIDLHLAPLKKGTWSSYTVLDGLAHNFVYSIHRAPDGVMWFGTEAGVSRHDGKGFVNFTTEDGLPQNWVMCIYQDRDGVMWFGTGDYFKGPGGGVSRYDGREFVNFTTEDGLPHNWIMSIYQDADGAMWFGTAGGGVSRYDGKGFVTFSTQNGLPHNWVLSIYQDTDGVMWFGTGRGVSRYDGKDFITFSTKDGLGKDSRVRAIHCDPDGVMWFGTWGGGVARYDGKEFVNFTTEDGLVGDTVTAIYRDPEGMLWFATQASGVSRYDGKGFVNFTTEDGLVHNGISNMCGAPDGAIWFATRGGVSRYDGQTFVNFTEKDGLARRRVRAIHRDLDGIMWFGTFGSGVFRYDPSATHAGGQGFVNFTTEDGLVHNHVSSICGTPDGAIWFATQGGISRYDGQTFVNFTEKDGLASSQVWAIDQDSDGAMWFGTRGGVSVYSPSAAQGGGQAFANLTTEDGLADNSVLAIHRAPDGVMWLGTLGGLSCYDRNRFVDFPANDAVANNSIRAIQRDLDGVIWFGTHSKGVFRYDGQELVNLTIKDGLASNVVEAIYRDIDGVMWFGMWGGFAGVSAYDGAAWTSLDALDGLASDNVHAIHQDPDGTLWFGTENGVTRYRRSTTPPTVRIDSVRTKQRYTALEALPPVTVGTRVTIEYHAIDFKTSPEKRQYRARVLDAEGQVGAAPYRAWTKPTKSTTFNWVPQESGMYAVAIQAIDRDLNYSQPASVMLKVVLPWYFNMWIALPAGTAMLALLSVLFSTIYMARTKVIRSRNEQLKQAVQQKQQEMEMLTARMIRQEKLATVGKISASVAHELRNPLGAIRQSIFFLKRLFNKELVSSHPKVDEHLELIEAELEVSSRVISDLLEMTKLKTVQRKQADLGEIIADAVKLSEIAARSELHIELRPNPFPIWADAVQLRMVLVNLLNNAVQAISEEGTVTIRAEMMNEDESCLIQILDDGKGIELDALSKVFDPLFSTKASGVGLGLSICKEIIEKHGGSINLISEPEKGTTVTIQLPCREDDEDNQ